MCHSSSGIQHPGQIVPEVHGLRSLGPCPFSSLFLLPPVDSGSTRFPPINPWTWCLLLATRTLSDTGGPLWREGLVFYEGNGFSLSPALSGPAKPQEKRVWVPSCLFSAFHEGAMVPPFMVPPFTNSWKTTKSGQVETGDREQSRPFHSILLDSKAHLAAAKRGKHKAITTGLWTEQASDCKMHNYFMYH